QHERRAKARLASVEHTQIALLRRQAANCRRLHDVVARRERELKKAARIRRRTLPRDGGARFLNVVLRRGGRAPNRDRDRRRVLRLPFREKNRSRERRAFPQRQQSDVAIGADLLVPSIERDVARRAKRQIEESLRHLTREFLFLDRTRDGRRRNRRRRIGRRRREADRQLIDYRRRHLAANRHRAKRRQRDRRRVRTNVQRRRPHPVTRRRRRQLPQPFVERSEGVV